MSVTKQWFSFARIVAIGASLCFALHVLHDITLHQTSNLPLNNQHMSNPTRLIINKPRTNPRDPHTEIKTNKNSNSLDPYSHPRKLKTSIFSQRNDKIRNMFLNRTKLINNVCEKYQNLTSNINFFLPKAYSLEPLEKLAICRTAKHGSTTWAKNFIHIYLG